MHLPLVCGSTEMDRVIKKFPETGRLGACKGQHFSKRISSGTNEQFFSLPFKKYTLFLISNLMIY